MLGGYNVLGSGAYLEKTYDMSSFSMQGVAHVHLEFFKIDSWDNEYAYLHVAGQLAWQQMLRYGTAHECGSAGFPYVTDGKVLASGSAPYSGGSALVRIDTTLNSAPDNEAWGIQNVRVYGSLASPAPPPSPPPAPPFRPLARSERMRSTSFSASVRLQ